MIWLPVVGNYADIDVYASVIAYADLLNQRGKPARTYIPTPPNYSVPSALRIPAAENTVCNLQPDDEVIILDISTPDVISKFTPDDQILELIDHHPGYEDYWHERIGDKAIIEKIGAVATSIFEWWGECWDYGKMSPQIAQLLLGAILDNTLNFNAEITTTRDHQAADQLAAIAQTTLEEFTTWYFSTVSHTVLADLQHALLQDCKIIKSPINRADLTFGQLAIWNATEAIKQIDAISKIMQTKTSSWLVSILSISEQKNYLLASSPELAHYFTKLLKLHSEGEWLTSDRLYLRKEIIGQIIG